MPRVLIVDNEPKLLERMGSAVQAEGGEVVKAKSLHEGMSYIRQGGFDAVVVDISLIDDTKDTSGLEILDAARSFDPCLPVIVVTNFGSVTKGVRAMQLGAFDYIDRLLPGFNWLGYLREKLRIALAYRASVLTAKSSRSATSA